MPCCESVLNSPWMLFQTAIVCVVFVAIQLFTIPRYFDFGNLEAQSLQQFESVFKLQGCFSSTEIVLDGLLS